MSAKVWTTRDGRKIPIRELEDSHLLNILRMLTRNGRSLRRAAIADLADQLHSAYRALCFLQGEHAIDSVVSGIHSLEYMQGEYGGMTDAEFLRSTNPYASLAREARRRGLEWEVILA